MHKTTGFAERPRVNMNHKQPTKFASVLHLYKNIKKTQLRPAKKIDYQKALMEYYYSHLAMLEFFWAKKIQTC